MDKVIAPQSLPSATVYKPSELIGIFNNYLSKQNTNAQVVFLRGVISRNQVNQAGLTAMMC